MRQNFEIDMEISFFLKSIVTHDNSTIAHDFHSSGREIDNLFISSSSGVQLDGNLLLVSMDQQIITLSLSNKHGLYGSHSSGLIIYFNLKDVFLPRV